MLIANVMYVRLLMLILVCWAKRSFYEHHIIRGSQLRFGYQSDKSGQARSASESFNLWTHAV